MLPQEVIVAKRDGGTLPAEAIRGFVEGLTAGTIGEGQVAAFAMAVLFRGIENFKMFDLINLLTSGGPGSTTEVASITLKRAAFESWRTGYSSAFAVILFVAVFGLANIYVKALNRVKQR